MGHFNTNSNKTATDKQVIRHVVGNAAIQVNDLVALGERGKVWPVETKPFSVVAKAGMDIFSTKINDYKRGSHYDYGNGYFDNNLATPDIYFDKATLQSFVLTSYQGSGNYTLYIRKFDEAGNNIKSLLLGTVDNIKGGAYLRALSNGNLLVVYQDGNTSYFTILNKNLDVVVAQTSMGVIIPRSIIAFSSGGFAVLATVSTTAPTTVTYRSFTNSGVAVVTPITITSTADDGEIAELSNGNIAVGLIGTNLLNGSVAVAILAPNGTAVSPLTAITVTGGMGGAQSLFMSHGLSNLVAISVINGFFCLCLQGNNGVGACVFNNAGQLKNYNNTYVYSASFTNVHCAIVNDGVGFWILDGQIVNISGGTPTGVGFTVIYLPTTGLNTDNKFYSYPYSVFEIPDYRYTSGSNPVTLFKGNSAAFYKRGMIIFTWKNTIIGVDTKTDGTINAVKSIENDPPGLDNPLNAFKYNIVDSGDGSYFYVGSLNSGYQKIDYVNGVPTVIGYTSQASIGVGVKKYLDTLILGTSKTTIAANSEDTTIDLIIGSGSFTINPIPGNNTTFDYTFDVTNDQSISRIFDPIFGFTTVVDTAKTVSRPGRSGTIFNNSVLFNK